MTIKPTFNKENIVESLETYHDALFTPGVYEHSVFGQAAMLLRRDTVEVVRCRDCICWQPEFGVCGRYCTSKPGNGYCDMGERRTDA